MKKHLGSTIALGIVISILGSDLLIDIIALKAAQYASLTPNACKISYND